MPSADYGARYAFASSPGPTKSSLHRIHVVFDGSNDRRWSSGTELTAITEESTTGYGDGFNVPLGSGHIHRKLFS